jgi:TRAP-type uncharacterized transport system substrate-binding protein
MDDLRGHRVAVGPVGSGSRETSELVFDSLNLSNEITREVIEWRELFSEDAPDAAMICIGRGSPLVARLVSDGRWRLIPIPTGVQISLLHPALDAMSIETSEFPDGQIQSDIPTVGTTAFLAARDDTPSALVIAFLQALYQEPPPCRGLLPQSQAGEWPTVAFHKAARPFLGLSED